MCPLSSCPYSAQHPEHPIFFRVNWMTFVTSWQTSSKLSTKKGTTKKKRHKPQLFYLLYSIVSNLKPIKAHSVIAHELECWFRQNIQDTINFSWRFIGARSRYILVARIASLAHQIAQPNLFDRHRQFFRSIRTSHIRKLIAHSCSFRLSFVLYSARFPPRAFHNAPISAELRWWWCA